MLFSQVDPTKFIDTAHFTPEHGRGAWTRAGIGDDYRYHLRRGVKVGDEAEKGLDEWAVSAGVWAIQSRLIVLGLLAPRKPENQGTFGRATKQAVIWFQQGTRDPEEDRRLEVDGTVGRGDARALWTPVIDRYTAKFGIPDRLLRGKLNHESRLDPAALGFFIYYERENALVYGGVDRAIAQINSKAQPQITWRQAFQPWTAIEWSARRMRNQRNEFKRDFPNRPDSMIWDAAVYAHNNPAGAEVWLEQGFPTAAGAAYVSAVKAARY